MAKTTLTLSAMLFFYLHSIAQVTASFTSVDTICAGEELSIVNTTTGDAQTFSWNFCGLNLTEEPSPVSLGDLGVLDKPSFITIVEEAGNYYGFVSNLADHALIRLDFGADLKSVPEAVHLGSNDGIVSGWLEGISVVKENDKWWGFGVTGGPGGDNLIRYDFGNSIENIPVPEVLGNIGEMDFPHELLIFKENEEWFGWTVSGHGEEMIRLSFGNSLANTPTGLNVGNVGELSFPTGFTTFQQDGEWHMLVCNDNSITRLDFGSFLTNVPTGINLGVSPVFTTSRDVILQEHCGELFGLTLIRNTNNVTLLDFQSDITNIPLAIPSPTIPELSFPHSYSNITLFETDVVFFVVNIDNNSLVRMDIEGCGSAFPLSSEAENPPPVVYQEAGEFVIELLVDEGLPTESSFCKNIVVLSADVDLGADTMFCKGATLELQSGYSQALWQDGTMASSISVNQTNTYIATVDTLNCTFRDSIYVKFSDCKNCLAFPNAFTPDGDGQNDSFTALNACPLNLLNYEMKIFNRWGKEVFRSNHISNGWNGMYNNKPAPTDVYIWQLTFSYPDAETGALLVLKEAGDLTLIR